MRDMPPPCCSVSILSARARAAGLRSESVTGAFANRVSTGLANPAARCRATQTKHATWGECGTCLTQPAPVFCSESAQPARRVTRIFAASEQCPRKFSSFYGLYAPKCIGIRFAHASRVCSQPGTKRYWLEAWGRRREERARGTSGVFWISCQK